MTDTGTRGTRVRHSRRRTWWLWHLYAIDPAHIRRNRLPPPVVIESVVGDDRTDPPATDLKLGKVKTSLRIIYVAYGSHGARSPWWFFRGLAGDR